MLISRLGGSGADDGSRVEAQHRMLNDAVGLSVRQLAEIFRFGVVIHAGLFASRLHRVANHLKVLRYKMSRKNFTV